MASRLNRRSTIARPAPPCLRARAGSSALLMMARASASGSAGGTSSPDAPASTSSGLPPTSVAMTGKEQAMASRMVFEIPSASDGSTKQSRPRNTSGTSSRSPGSQAKSAIPASRKIVCAAVRDGPSPTITSRNRVRKCGARPSAIAKARAKFGWSLTACILPTVPTSQ